MIVTSAMTWKQPLKRNLRLFHEWRVGSRVLNGGRSIGSGMDDVHKLFWSSIELRINVLREDGSASAVVSWKLRA